MNRYALDSMVTRLSERSAFHERIDNVIFCRSDQCTLWYNRFSLTSETLHRLFTRIKRSIIRP